MFFMDKYFTRCLRGALILFAVGLVGCASTPQQQNEFTDTTVKNVDPLEGFNRKIFAFNDTVDTWFLKPVAKGYRWAAPAPVEVGVSNFFDNLGEVSNIVNDALQWKWKQAGNDTGRLLLNTTVGLLGTIDVARHAGLEKSDGEDFGQTLAVWGVNAGPYLVLPLMGPTTLRDGLAMPADYYTDPINYIEDDAHRYGLKALELVQLRAKLLDVEDLAGGGGDKYIFMRDAYLQRREHLVNDGAVEDDFGGDFGEDGY